MSLPDPIIERLTKLAGLSEYDLNNGSVRVGLVSVLSAFYFINKGKTTHYGDYIKGMLHPNRIFSRMQLLGEVKRKFKRLEAMALRECEGEEVTNDEWLETLADLGVYAAMGVDLILEEEREAKGDGVGAGKPKVAIEPSTWKIPNPLLNAVLHQLAPPFQDPVPQVQEPLMASKPSLARQLDPFEVPRESAGHTVHNTTDPVPMYRTHFPLSPAEGDPASQSTS